MEDTLPNTHAASPDSGKFVRRALVAAALIACASLVAVYAFRPKSTVERMGIVPQFSFEAIPPATGSRTALGDLAGKVWVGGFIFTHCQGICPILSAKMKWLQESLGDISDFRMVSFSIDPERDTPAALEAFRAKYTAQSDRWIFARPTRAELTDFAQGLKLVVGDIGDFAHTSRLVLIDRQGYVRGYYHGTDEEQVSRLLGDARSILRE